MANNYKQPNQNSLNKNQKIWSTINLNLAVINIAIILVFCAYFFKFIVAKQESRYPQSSASEELINNEQIQAEISAAAPKNLHVDAVPVQTFKEVDGVPSGRFNYGGSTAWAPIRKKVDSVIQTQRPEFKLHYLQHPVLIPSSNTGIKMLLSEELTIVQSSRPLHPQEYQLAKKRNVILKQIPIAIDGIVFAVNPQLNIPGLTLIQLQDIYTGKIVNWKQLGGPDLKIIPYSQPPRVSGTAEFVIEYVLDKQKLGSNVKLVASVTEAIRKVNGDRGAIFYGSAAEIIGQCTIKSLPIGSSLENLIAPYIEPPIDSQECPQRRNQIDRQVFQSAKYPLTHYLFVIIKQNGKIEEQAGIAYANMLLSQQGQKLISEAGYVPIR